MSRAREPGTRRALRRRTSHPSVGLTVLAGGTETPVTDSIEGGRFARFGSRSGPAEADAGALAGALDAIAADCHAFVEEVAQARGLGTEDVFGAVRTETSTSLITTLVSVRAGDFEKQFDAVRADPRLVALLEWSLREAARTTEMVEAVIAAQPPVPPADLLTTIGSERLSHALRFLPVPRALTSYLNWDRPEPLRDFEIGWEQHNGVQRARVLHFVRDHPGLTGEELGDALHLQGGVLLKLLSDLQRGSWVVGRRGGWESNPDVTGEPIPPVGAVAAVVSEGDVDVS